MWEEIKPMNMINTDDFIFRINPFKKQSYQFLIVIGLTILMSFFGILFALSLPILFFFSPFLWYFIFAKIPKYLLRLGNSSFGSVLGLLPFINFKGQWFLESKSEHRDLNNSSDFWIFLKEYFTQYAFINLGIFYLLFNFNTIVGTQFVDLASLGYFQLAILAVNLCGLVFVVVKTLEDVELKIMKTDPERHVHGLIDVSYSYKSLFIIYLGISVLGKSGFGLGQNNDQVLSDLLSIILYGIGITFFMAFVYYQSSFHQHTVNQLRMYLLRHREAYNLVIGRVEFDKLYCNSCGNVNQYPNYYCTSCGKDTSQLYSMIFDQPVTIGTMVYLDQTPQIDDTLIRTIESRVTSPWNRWHKIQFVLSMLIPVILVIGGIIMLIALFGS